MPAVGLDSSPSLAHAPSPCAQSVPEPSRSGRLRWLGVCAGQVHARVRGHLVARLPQASSDITASTPRDSKDVGWLDLAFEHREGGASCVFAQAINGHGSRQTVAVGEDRGQLDCWELDPASGQLAVNAAAAPRAGVEPASLVLIQSQAGPADRPTGERPPSGGRLNSTVGDDRRANQPVDFTTGSGRDRLCP